MRDSARPTKRGSATSRARIGPRQGAGLLLICTALACGGGAGGGSNGTSATDATDDDSGTLGDATAATSGTDASTDSNGTMGTADSTATDGTDTDTDTGGPTECELSNPQLHYDQNGIHLLPDEPYGVAVGDLDEDGLGDIAVAMFGPQQIEVMLSAGDWRRPVHSTIDVDLHPSTVRLADINGDGHLDLVTNGINVYLGDGSGTLTHLGHFEDDSGGLSYELVVVDLDGDGDLDVATANLQGQSVSVLHNNGTGALALAQVVSTWQAWSIDAGDFDGDGDVDLVVGTGDPTTTADVKLLRNQGNGMFAAYEEYGDAITVDYARAADLDGDGDLDVVGFRGVDLLFFWLENNGAGNLSIEHEIDIAGYSPEGLQVADLDADGDIDLATVGFEEAMVYENDGLGNFVGVRSHIGRQVERMALGDINGDGRLDIATIGEDSNVAVTMLGDGVGAPYPPNRWVSDSDPEAAVLGDFDGDGTIDLAVAVAGINGGMEVARNVSGVDVMLEEQSGLDDAYDIAAGDFDGDGVLDPIMVGEGATARVLLNGRGGSFEMVSSSFGQGVGRAVSVGDIDQDGNLDAIVLQDCYVRVGLGLGTGELSNGGMLSIDASYCRDSALADLDDDGNLDVIVVHYQPAGLTVLPGLGGTNFGAARMLPLPGSPVAIATGDADGDGDLDVFAVWGDAGLLVNDGGVLSLGPSLVLPSFASYVSAADLDGDGDAEAVLSSPNFDALFVLDLVGGSVEVVAEHAVLDPRGVAIEDADGDCVPDLAVAGGGSETATLLRALP